jgi:hypothetical protein
MPHITRRAALATALSLPALSARAQGSPPAWVPTRSVSILCPFAAAARPT